MSRYYNTIDLDTIDYLEHSGVKGMKWGIRRYQNEDGTLTPAGQKRYNTGTTSRSKQIQGYRRHLDDLHKYQKKSIKYSKSSSAEQVKIGKSNLQNAKKLTNQVLKDITDNNLTVKRVYRAQRIGRTVASTALGAVGGLAVGGVAGGSIGFTRGLTVGLSNGLATGLSTGLSSGMATGMMIM